MGKWQNQVTDIENYQGFVYIITNKLTKKKYIGKKFYWFKKGKKRVESDWKTYYGSSNKLNKDIKKYGKKSFTRVILHHCKSKAGCAYMECKEQIEREVLFSDEYYNGMIRVRLPRFKKENM